MISSNTASVMVKIVQNHKLKKSAENSGTANKIEYWDHPHPPGKIQRKISNFSKNKVDINLC
jgi:hypothetical protein